MRAFQTCPSTSQPLPLLSWQEAGISYEVEVLVEATDESVSGVGDSICKRAEELGAAAVSLFGLLRLHGPPGLPAPDVHWLALRCRAPGLLEHSLLGITDGRGQSLGGSSSVT